MLRIAAAAGAKHTRPGLSGGNGGGRGREDQVGPLEKMAVKKNKYDTITGLICIMAIKQKNVHDTIMGLICIMAV